MLPPVPLLAVPVPVCDEAPPEPTKKGLLGFWGFSIVQSGLIHPPPPGVLLCPGHTWFGPKVVFPWPPPGILTFPIPEELEGNISSKPAWLMFPWEIWFRKYSCTRGFSPEKSLLPKLNDIDLASRLARERCWVFCPRWRTLRQERPPLPARFATRSLTRLTKSSWDS